MGTPAAPQAHGARRPSGDQVRQGLLRVRRERQEEVLDQHERDATRKATLWSAIAALALFASTVAGEWSFALVTVGYGLVLPLIALMHARHLTVRQSGAVLGTTTGAATVTLGIVAGAVPQATLAVFFVNGMWWWTIGKLWWETGLLHRALGLVTMALAGVAFALALAWLVGIDLRVVLRVLFGLWLIAVARLASLSWR